MANAARGVIWFGLAEACDRRKRRSQSAPSTKKFETMPARRTIGIYISAMIRFTQKTNNFNP